MIEVKGVAEAQAALQAKVTAIEAATRAAVTEAAHLLEKTAKQKLATSSHARGTPTPSAPGDPPSLITGNLRRSITVTGPTSAVVLGLPGWEARIGPTAIYGRIQELGGDTGRSTLPARPYLGPALEEVRPKLYAIFAGHWSAAMMA